MTKKLHTATTIVLCMVFIVIGGLFYDIHEHTPSYKRLPILWPIAIAFSSAGGTTLFNMFLNATLPAELSSSISK